MLCLPSHHVKISEFRGVSPEVKRTYCCDSRSGLRPHSTLSLGGTPDRPQKGKNGRALLTYEVARMVRSMEAKKSSGHQDQCGKNRMFVC